MTFANKFFQYRILSQIEEGGVMPEELARTRPLFYSIYNLHARFLVANLAKKVDIDVWKTDNGDSRLRDALDYLVPYIDPEKNWTNPTIGITDRLEVFPLLQMADREYPDVNYLKLSEKFPLEKREILRINLAFPLMR